MIAEEFYVALPDLERIEAVAQDGDFRDYVDEIVRAVKLTGLAKDGGLTDLIIDADRSPRFFLHGMPYRTNLPKTPQHLMNSAKNQLSRSAQESFDEEMDAAGRFELASDKSIIRMHLYKANRSTCSVLRLQPSHPYSWEQMGLPDTILETLDRPQGLVLFSGPVGSRKTAAAHALIDSVNNRHDRPAHVITIEDPPEASHQERAAIIHQRELGFTAKTYDTAIYGSGLRALPRYLLIGEMRNPATIEAALMAASLGRLVISTIHSESSYQTISRMKQPFPTDRQNEILEILRDTLVMIVNLRTVRGVNGSLVLAYEILNIDTKARENFHDLTLLSNNLDTDGSIRLEKCLSDLAKRHLISRETAMEHSNRVDFLEFA